MPNFKTITPEAFTGNPFTMIGTDWMLLCAQKADGKTNAMTAAWGGMGVMWSMNVAYVVIRPQRFTKEFVDTAHTFSLSFFEEQKKMLGYMGKVSGRDEDKIKQSGLTVLHEGNTPYFEEAQVAMICKKLYVQPFKPECFVAPDIDAKMYPDHDYHTMYIAQIEKILVKE
jgi:flavin reductase (DIM6/NTAB) family NADH-FMN oxidoreductase RutF